MRRYDPHGSFAVAPTRVGPHSSATPTSHFFAAVDAVPTLILHETIGIVTRSVSEGLSCIDVQTPA